MIFLLKLNFEKIYNVIHKIILNWKRFTHSHCKFLRVYILYITSWVLGTCLPSYFKMKYNGK